MWSSHSITSKCILLDWYLAIFSEPVQTAISVSCSEGSPVPCWLKHLQILASDASSPVSQFVDPSGISPLPPPPPDNSKVDGMCYHRLVEENFLKSHIKCSGFTDDAMMYDAFKMVFKKPVG